MEQILVTESSSDLRAIARASLQGNWKVAAMATAVYMIALTLPASILDILFGGPDGVSSLSGVYSMIVAGPFTLGYSVFCLSLFRQKEYAIAQVFSGFEKVLKALGLYIVMSIFIGLWCILLIVPGIIAAYRYSQCFLIMVDNPDYGIMQCLSESKRIMAGNKMKFFCLQFSFMGWALLAVLPMMVLVFVASFAMVMSGMESNAAISVITLIGLIPYFWLIPYISVASAAFYDIAIGNLKPGVIDVAPTVIESLDETNDHNAL